MKAKFFLPCLFFLSAFSGFSQLDSAAICDSMTQELAGIWELDKLLTRQGHRPKSMRRNFDHKLVLSENGCYSEVIIMKRDEVVADTGRWYFDLATHSIVFRAFSEYDTIFKHEMPFYFEFKFQNLQPTDSIRGTEKLFFDSEEDQFVIARKDTLIYLVDEVFYASVDSLKRDRLTLIYEMVPLADLDPPYAIFKRKED